MLRPLADACFAGDLASCDTLYVTTDVGSAEEFYGLTCGLRLDVEITVRVTAEDTVSCASIFGPNYHD